MNIEKDLIIILLIALLIFGPSKLAGLGSALGKTIRDFRRAMEGGEEQRAQSPHPEEATRQERS
ncbi:MAG: twin-arginine translocase TatA/TatE family subunit [Armatimonadota bacterium]|nr:twin-arginine translocase TatA/TatE family subunit [Armatimonadota bacterium]MDR5703713.1 twin-arginine translocase TatA/TatE family subunit [Armatimonadota bacterium]